MRIKIWGALLTAGFVAMTIAGPALAEDKKPDATKAATKTSTAKTSLGSMTCEEFAGLDESFQPTVVAWAAGYHQGRKKPEAVAVDVQGIEKITPVIAEACKKTPKEHFWRKVEAELKKMF